MEIVKNRKGKNEKILDGYRFQKIRDGQFGKSYWRCENKICVCRLVVEDEEVSKQSGFPHNHGAPSVTVSRMKAINRMRERARSELTPLTRIHQEVVQDTISEAADAEKEEVAANLPTYTVMAQLSRACRAHLPQIPHNPHNLNIPRQFSVTAEGKRFLLFQEGSIFAFASDEGLDLLKESDYIFMDGTFKSSPSLFYQIYTIHIVREWKQYPVVFFLLPDKTEATYSAAFRALQQNCQNLNPRYIFTDMESAVIVAIRMQFYNSIHKFCNFHFNQALFRKVQSLGIVAEYNDVNSGVKQFVRSCSALAFLPLHDMDRAWQLLLEEVPDVFCFDKGEILLKVCFS